MTPQSPLLPLPPGTGHPYCPLPHTHTKKNHTKHVSSIHHPHRGRDAADGTGPREIRQRERAPSVPLPSPAWGLPLGLPRHCPHCPQVRLPDSPEQQPVTCAIVVIAAGAWSGELLATATASLPGGSLAPLPIQPRKRSVPTLNGGIFRPAVPIWALFSPETERGRGAVPAGTSTCGTAPTGRAWSAPSSLTPQGPIFGARASLATS